MASNRAITPNFSLSSAQQGTKIWRNDKSPPSPTFFALLDAERQMKRRSCAGAQYDQHELHAALKVTEQIAVNAAPRRLSPGSIMPVYKFSPADLENLTTY